MDLEWLMDNLDLMAAVYTFLGQYKFYQAIYIEALPGRDPELVDLQYYYRVGANLDYTLAALIKLISQYVNNLDYLQDLETTATTVDTGSTTTASTENNDVGSVVYFNEAVESSPAISANKLVTVKIVRKGMSSHWKKAGVRQVIKIYPSGNS